MRGHADQTARSRCSAQQMSDPPERADKVQETIGTLLATTERCRRLAASITDRQTVESLLQIAQECEERAAALREGSR
jgi:hypothetical protein